MPDVLGEKRVEVDMCADEMFLLCTDETLTPEVWQAILEDAKKLREKRWISMIFQMYNTVEYGDLLPLSLMWTD